VSEASDGPRRTRLANAHGDDVYCIGSTEGRMEWHQVQTASRSDDRSMKRHDPLTMLVLAFVLAFLFAILWVVVMTWTLPKTDLAYGQGPFEDPLVLPIMSIGASFAALITYPFFYFVLRDRQLPRALAILVATVIGAIVILTPINAGLGFLGTFGAYFVGLAIARLCSPLNVMPGHCEACGYNLRGIPDKNKCPECGSAPRRRGTVT
jgi:hypothetical protein